MASTMQHLATNVEAMVVIKKNAVVASVQMEDFTMLIYLGGKKPYAATLTSSSVEIVAGVRSKPQK